MPINTILLHPEFLFLKVYVAQMFSVVFGFGFGLLLCCYLISFGFVSWCFISCLVVPFWVCYCSSSFFCAVLVL